ncbi:mitogen-activated protein kinase kinase kinase 2-like isoform X2 [Asterias rubens]|uniref:mitogen-activated protein kinase kinase kinase 2-like isoform X2 n=1 Tax=Asterias rubens TaxID=7604 RepID=UPI001455C274|nr:mitogen-activated protein kinase kinase kinase 2-like isoform X2 [Asterias rubens]
MLLSHDQGILSMDLRPDFALKGKTGILSSETDWEGDPIDVEGISDKGKEEVIQEITSELVQALKESSTRHKPVKTSSTQTNEVRVKFEYQGERRILQVPRPLNYNDLLTKARTAYGLPVDMHYTTNDVNSNIVVPIKSQTNLNQAVALMDHNPNAKSLRVYLTPLQSDTSTATASTPSSTTGTGSSAPGLGHSKSAGTIAYHDSISGGGDLYDTAIRSDSTHKPATLRSQSIPQSQSQPKLPSQSKRHSTPVEMPTRDTPSPPPGYIPTESMQNIMRNSTYGEGRFIPEPESEQQDHVIINSPNGSHQSLDKAFYGGSQSLGSNSGRMFRAQSTNSYEEFTNSQYSERSGKGGTFPTRYSMKNTQNEYDDGRKTFPSRSRRPQLSPSMMNRDDYSPHGSEHSLSKSSSSSGIGADYDTIDSRRRRDSELEHSIKSLQEMSIKEGAKSPRAPVNWRKGKILGQGAFGVVYLCYDADTGRELAVKQVPTDNSNNEARKEVKALKSEIELLRNLHHDRIVQYFGCSEDKQVLSIFMELMPGGSVKDELRSYGALTENVVRKYTRQILEGVAYLHISHIVHRDIKGANILRAGSGNVKLADFGASRRLQTIASFVTGIKSVTGTPYWMSPEVINGVGYGRKADVWSVGCTVVEMLTTKPPWADYEAMAAIFKIATQPTIPQLPSTVSDISREFLRLTLIRDAQERPWAHELLRHDFVNNFSVD